MNIEALNKYTLILIVFILGFLIIEGINLYFHMKNDPEIVGKPPYSFLQWAEQKNRGLFEGKKFIFEKEKIFCAVGINEREKKVWLLLNYSDDLNGVYILGDEQYSLTKQDYDEMKKFCEIDPRVNLELKKHLR